MRRTFFAALIAGVVACACIGGQGSAQTPGATVNLRGTLDFVRYGGNAPFTHAQQGGYLAKYGISIVWDAAKGSQDAVVRMASGVYDVGVVDVSTLVDFIGSYPDNAPKAVMIIMDRSPQVVISRKSSGIAKPADLVGRPVGSAQTDGASKMFPAFLRANGLMEAQVQRQLVDVRVRDQMLARGTVDAVIGFDYTTVFNLKGLGMAVEDLAFLYYADHGLDQFGQALVVTRELLRRDPEMVKKIVLAVARAWIDAVVDPFPAVKSVAALDPIIVVDLEAARLKWLIDHEVVTPNTRRNGLGAYDPARMQTNIDVVSAGLSLPRKPAIAEVYDDRFLPPLSERTLPVR
jgi:NitT/TauT family transport system substrate-binding protein